MTIMIVTTLPQSPKVLMLICCIFGFTRLHPEPVACPVCTLSCTCPSINCCCCICPSYLERTAHHCGSRPANNLQLQTWKNPPGKIWILPGSSEMAQNHKHKLHIVFAVTFGGGWVSNRPSFHVSPVLSNPPPNLPPKDFQGRAVVESALRTFSNLLIIAKGFHLWQCLSPSRSPSPKKGW